MGSPRRTPARLFTIHSLQARVSPRPTQSIGHVPGGTADRPVFKAHALAGSPTSGLGISINGYGGPDGPGPRPPCILETYVPAGVYTRLEIMNSFFVHAYMQLHACAYACLQSYRLPVVSADIDAHMHACTLESYSYY